MPLGGKLDEGFGFLKTEGYASGSAEMSSGVACQVGNMTGPLPGSGTLSVQNLSVGTDWV